MDLTLNIYPIRSHWSPEYAANNRSKHGHNNNNDGNCPANAASSSQKPCLRSDPSSQESFWSNGPFNLPLSSLLFSPSLFPPSLCLKWSVHIRRRLYFASTRVICSRFQSITFTTSRLLLEMVMMNMNIMSLSNFVQILHHSCDRVEVALTQVMELTDKGDWQTARLLSAFFFPPQEETCP